MLLLALHGAVALTNGWEVHQANRFCYMWRPAAQASAPEFALALDGAQRPTLILSNRAWQIQPDRKYRIKAGVDGALKSRDARALRISGDVTALVAPIDERGFIERFAAAPALRFTIEEPAKLGLTEAEAEGSISLGGASAALAAVRQCAAAIEQDERDISRQQAKRALPRPDPYDQRDPGSPPTGDH